MSRIDVDDLVATFKGQAVSQEAMDLALLQVSGTPGSAMRRITVLIDFIFRPLETTHPDSASVWCSQLVWSLSIPYPDLVVPPIYFTPVVILGVRNV